MSVFNGFNGFIVVCSIIDPIVTIMAKMAFIFFAYKGIQAMNTYINRASK
ncbi:hypothetical protein GCM10008905_17030 [Clostridium malenominatum]|uniref:Uncharacterized protein n=1 Tax=Clostridium malenominatum TaxID=1539 RepID=A0ABN1IY91_9CLOT